MRNQQLGVGLIEVLIALFILAIGVIGFALLQLRAIDASREAMNKMQAMNLARDLSEKIRANASQYSEYARRLNAESPSASVKAYVQLGATNPCPILAQFTAYDVAQIIRQANQLAMKIKMPNCQLTHAGQDRRCIYVAWGETKAIDSGSDPNACTNGGSYLPQAQCIVMELY